MQSDQGPEKVRNCCNYAAARWIPHGTTFDDQLGCAWRCFKEGKSGAGSRNGAGDLVRSRLRLLRDQVPPNPKEDKNPPSGHPHGPEDTACRVTALRRGACFRSSTSALVASAQQSLRGFVTQLSQPRSSPRSRGTIFSYGWKHENADVGRTGSASSQRARWPSLLETEERLYGFIESMSAGESKSGYGRDQGPESSRMPRATATSKSSTLR